MIASTISEESADDSVVNDLEASVGFANEPDVEYNRMRDIVLDPDADALINKYVCGISGLYIIELVNLPGFKTAEIFGNVRLALVLTEESSIKNLVKLNAGYGGPTLLSTI
jgi:hypothetical protein